MSTYQYELVYRKGTEVAPADALSRWPRKSEGKDIMLEDMFSFSEFQEPITELDVQEKMKEDSILKEVLKYMREGWPSKSKEAHLKPYFSRYLELSIENDCLFWGNRLIIPYQLRHEVLELLHEQHIGMVRMKMLARGEVWWPGIDDEIERFVQRCEPCQLNQNRASPVLMMSWPKTTRNYQRVHIDFLQKWGQYFLLIVDSHSKWLDIHIMNYGTTAEKTLGKLHNSFAYFGLPEEIVSDNGPPFNGSEYRQFCLRNGIKCTLIPPNHPKSNGFAEKQVSTIKKGLVKQLYENRQKKLNISMQQQIDNFVFKFRNTPTTSTGCSPAELMLKRKPRTKLSLLKPVGGRNIGNKRADKAKEEEANSGRRKMRRFFEGQQVLVFLERGNSDCSWTKGRIAKIVSAVTYLVEVGGSVKLMHADHIRLSHLVELPEMEVRRKNEKLAEILLPEVSESRVKENGEVGEMNSQECEASNLGRELVKNDLRVEKIER